MCGMTVIKGGSATAFVLFAGAAAMICAPSPAESTTTNEPPEVIRLHGTVRDFRERGVPGGHPDFERQPDRGFGLYCGNVAPTLGGDGKPVFTGQGFRVKNDRQWRDRYNRPICHLLYDSSIDGEAGQIDRPSTGGIQSAETFNQWFNDVPGVNLSAPLGLTFVRQPDGSYVFDDKLDPQYAQKGGFFPIDGQLFGNSSGTPKHNFHFTFELHTRFTYRAGTGQIFKFIGDDDVWVFINNQLVIDLGGVHSQIEQYVDLDRLGLEDGKSYPLSFFFAERHRTQSNFRIVTTLELQTAELAAITNPFD